MKLTSCPASVSRSAPPVSYGRLDFLYTPSPDVAGDVAHFTDALGARLVFAIEAFGARVAMVRLAGEPPDLVFADDLEGQRPIFVYRVDSLDRAAGELRERGFD